MIPSLSERLGKKGYTVVARAPQVGLPQFADGSWHVVGGSNPTQPEQMHETEEGLVAFILSQGGDVVLYRLSDDGMGSARPLLSRGGMAGRPPDLSAVLSFDPHLMRRLSELRAGLAEPVGPPEPPRARPGSRRRAAACAMAGVALLLGATAYVAMPGPAPGGGSRWVPDMNNPRDVAITKGATVVAMPRGDDPETLELYRIYPGAPGKGARDQVGAFRKRDLERVQGELPDSRIQWRRDF